jgi:Bax protein
MRPSVQQPTLFQRNLFVVICLVSGLILWSWYQSLISERAYDKSVAPDFSAMSNVDGRKQGFIDYLYPLIAEENGKILQQRSQLLSVEQQLQSSGRVKVEQALWLERLAAHYAVKFDKQEMQASIRLLLRRINIIPSSLVLAQAANESAWGTSRFAIEANNYFGQWCFREGCGLVPKERDEGHSHEVKNFNSVVDSVKSYLHMLNSGKAYALLRNLRQQRLEEEKPLTGYELAAGLAKYSERGTAYVASIRSLIVANHLQHYSDALYVSLAGGRSQQAF